MEISKLVSEKYKMAQGIAPGTFHFKGEVIDMTTVDLVTLENAVANDFDVVVAIKPALEKKK